MENSAIEKGRTARRFAVGVCASLVMCVFSSTSAAQHYEDEKLTAFDGGAYDDFGFDVAVLDDLAIVGAYGDDATGGTDSGSAYIYRRTGQNWAIEQKLQPTDPAASDYFGYAVELHLDMAIVGAIGDDPGGSVYIFRFSPSGGQWVQVQKLVAPDVQQGDSFGCALDASGRYLAIGARMDSDVAKDAGSVYIYEYEDGIQQWVYLNEFRASDGSADEWFGEYLAMDGDYVIVGLPRDDLATGFDSGSAYIFKRIVGTWIQQKKIVPGDGHEDYEFASDVGISGDTVIIGAHQDWPAAKRTGSAYIYRGHDAVWNLEQKIFDPLGNHWDYFGCAVDITGDLALIGANGSDANGIDFGAAYVFTRSGTMWTQHEPLYFDFDGATFDWLGSAVNLNGSTAIAGAYGDDWHGVNTGSACVFNQVLHALDVQPRPLIAGSNGTFTMTGGQPNTSAYLAYSMSGVRKTSIPMLNVTIDLRQPKQAGKAKKANLLGTVIWSLPIPQSAKGRNLWLQAIQNEWKTNVMATSVQ